MLVSADGRWADNDDDASTLAYRQNSSRERGIPFHVQVGIWLVEDNKKRIAIKCASEPDELPLPARESHPSFTHARLKTFRQTHDHLVDASRLGCVQNAFGVVLATEP